MSVNEITDKYLIAMDSDSYIRFLKLVERDTKKLDMNRQRYELKENKTRFRRVTAIQHEILWHPSKNPVKVTITL